jgi:hypothetical protein
MDTHRWVSLLDNRVEAKPVIQAGMYRGYPATELETIEATWAKAREQAANAR